MMSLQRRIAYVNGYLEGIISLANTAFELLEDNAPGEDISAKAASLANCVDIVAVAAQGALRAFTAEKETAPSA